MRSAFYPPGTLCERDGKRRSRDSHEGTRKGTNGEKTRMENGGSKMEEGKISLLLFSILHLPSPPPSVLVFLRVPSWATSFSSFWRIIRS